MSGDVGADVAAVHGRTPGICSCGHRFGWERAVADALAPLIAERVEAAKAEAYAEGVRAVQAEAEPYCSRSFACTRTPTNPYATGVG